MSANCTMPSDPESIQPVELHRAESIQPLNPSEVQTDEEKLIKHDDVYSYISSKATSFFSEIKQLKIEVVMFLCMFSYIMRSVSSVSMILDKVCIVHLNQTEYVCHHLKDHPELKSTAEKMANNYHLGHSMLQMLPAGVLACFIGAWSDKYGRKPPIIWALVGVTIDGLGSSICAWLFYSEVGYFFIPAIFTGFSGGYIGFLTVVYSYTSDISTYKQRTMKYTIIELVFGISLPIGIFAGGYLYQSKGYFAVFMVSSVGQILALAFALFVLEETKGLDNTDSWSQKFRSFWSLEPAVESYKAVVKLRPNKGKEQILLLIIAMGITVISSMATGSITYLFVHHLYDWDNTTYSTVNSIFLVTATLSMFVAVPVLKRFGFDDPILALIGTCSLFIKFMVIGLVQKVEVFYIGNLLGLLTSLAHLGGRSRISKVASKNDTGKIFAFVTSTESILPILTSGIVSQVFNATLDFYAGTSFLLMGSFMVIPLGIYIWMARLPDADYEELYENSQQTDTEAQNEKENETLKN